MWVHNNAELENSDVFVQQKTTELEHPQFTDNNARDTRVIETKQQRFFDKRMVCADALNDLETWLCILRRWEPYMKEYKDAEELLNLEVYQKALNHLEVLVVSQLFELSKMNQSGTGENQELFKMTTLPYY